MAPMPWVSRELYDRVVDDLRRSEEERRLLTDRLLARNGVAPMLPLQALAEAMPAPGTPEAEEVLDSGTGMLSISKVIAMGNAAAKKKAGIA